MITFTEAPSSFSCQEVVGGERGGAQLRALCVEWSGDSDSTKMAVTSPALPASSRPPPGTGLTTHHHPDRLQDNKKL